MTPSEKRITMADLPADEQRELLWRILPGALSGQAGLRPRTIAARLALPVETVDAHLADMESERIVSRNGGWWRRRS